MSASHCFERHEGFLIHLYVGTMAVSSLQQKGKRGIAADTRIYIYREAEQILQLLRFETKEGYGKIFAFIT